MLTVKGTFLSLNKHKIGHETPLKTGQIYGNSSHIFKNPSWPLSSRTLTSKAPPEMSLLRPLTAALLLLLLIQPLAIYMQFNNGNNGFNQGTGNNYPAGGYSPYYYGNGYGFCYVNTPYCCYNYIPPNFLYLLGPLLSQILRSLSLPNLSNLLNTLQATSPLSPGFLGGLQNSNPPIYNAYNQLSNAYSGMDPAMQQMFRQFCAAMFPAFQNALGNFNSQQTPQFDQNFPQLANFLRSPGMQEFARDPSPFVGAPTPSNQGPSVQAAPSANAAGPNPSIAQMPVPNQGQPTQNVANQGQQLSGGGGTGGPGLFDGILGAVGNVASAASNAVQQG